MRKPDSGTHSTSSRREAYFNELRGKDNRIQWNQVYKMLPFIRLGEIWRVEWEASAFCTRLSF